MYTFLCGHIFLFLLGIYLGVALLVQMITPYLTFWGTANSFPKRLYHIICSPAVYKCKSVPLSPHPWQHLLLSAFYHSHPSGCDALSRVVWYACPWWLVMPSIFSCAACLSSEIYSDSLTIFKIRLSLILMKSNFLISSFVVYVVCVICKKALPNLLRVRGFCFHI